MRIEPDSHQPADWREFQARNKKEPISRRSFLGVIGGAAAAVSLLKMGWDAVGQHSEIADTAEGFRERALKVRNPEVIPEGCLVPEDERTGENIMIGTIPTYYPIPVPGVDQYGVEETFGSELSPTLQNFPDGTNVHLVTTKDAASEVMTFATASHPGLKFHQRSMPRARGGLDYMQDTVFATGGVDQKGRFIIAASTLDAREARSFARIVAEQIKMAGFYRYDLSIDALRDVAVNPNDDVTARAGLQRFGDELLAEESPDEFNLKYVPVKSDGGDLQVVRMPNGEKGLIVGKENLFFSIFALGIENGDVETSNASEVKDLEIDPLKFVKLMEQVKANYIDSFGVDHLIVLDEEDLLKRVSRVRDVVLKAAVDMDFFHADMVVKTATDKDGKRVAFCTTVDKVNPNFAYLSRIRQQFEELGFEIEELPCGEYATLNYTNTTMFSPRGGQKTVIVPQYGIPEDAQAVEAYRRRGFKVGTADHSYIKERDPESAKRSGGPHCKVVVMN